MSQHTEQWVGCRSVHRPSWEHGEAQTQGGESFCKMVNLELMWLFFFFFNTVW